MVDHPATITVPRWPLHHRTVRIRKIISFWKWNMHLTPGYVHPFFVRSRQYISRRFQKSPLLSTSCGTMLESKKVSSIDFWQCWKHDFQEHYIYFCDWRRLSTLLLPAGAMWPRLHPESQKSSLEARISAANAMSGLNLDFFLLAACDGSTGSTLVLSICSATQIGVL